MLLNDFIYTSALQYHYHSPAWYGQDMNLYLGYASETFDFDLAHWPCKYF